MLHGFLPFSPVSLTELCSFWYGLKDLFTLHKSADKVAVDVTSGRKGVDLHGLLRAAQGRMAQFLVSTPAKIRLFFFYGNAL